MQIYSANSSASSQFKSGVECVLAAMPKPGVAEGLVDVKPRVRILLQQAFQQALAALGQRALRHGPLRERELLVADAVVANLFVLGPEGHLSAEHRVDEAAQAPDVDLQPVGLPLDEFRGSVASCADAESCLTGG